MVYVCIILVLCMGYYCKQPGIRSRLLHKTLNGSVQRVQLLWSCIPEGKLWYYIPTYIALYQVEELLQVVNGKNPKEGIPAFFIR